VTYSEAEDLPAALKPLFRAQPEAEPEWEARTGGGEREGHLPDAFIQRAAAKDAVAIGRDLLVMLDNQIVRLGGVGPAIWEASASPVRTDQLAQAVGKVHGTPEGYRHAIASATQQLVEKSVLEQGSK
jgi:hypothetical protein